MTLINLLPWREQARKEKKVRFGLLLLGFLLVTVLVLVVMHIYISYLISQQQRINEFIEAELVKEKTTLMQLKKTQAKHDSVLKELRFIFSLKESGFDAVRMLNEMTYLIPENVVLTKLSSEGNTTVLEGTAQTNLQVTLLIENIEKSKDFMSPVLTEINAKEENVSNKRNFILTFTQRRRENAKLIP
jgi:type IV pilus assembly protein PilN